MNRIVTTGLLLATAAFAQEDRLQAIAAEGVPEPPPPGAQNTVYFERRSADSGETKANRVMSDVFMTRFAFDGKTVKGAPYSAEATTESTQVLSDGNRIIHKNTTTLYRDGLGRTRREETINAIGVTPSSDAFQSISINDPVAQVSYVLEPNTKTARKLPNMINMGGGPGNFHVMVDGPHGAGGAVVGMATTAVAAPPMHGAAGGATFSMHMTVPDGEAPKTEQLGKQTIEGVSCEGTRTTITIPAGQMGNERAINIVNERWYSPDLQVTVLSKNVDPRIGETVYKLTRINRAEPVPSLFQVPSDYTINSDAPMPMMRTLRKDKERE